MDNPIKILEYEVYRLLFAVLEPLKLTVRKTLLSDSGHVLSDITPQFHVSITIILVLVSHETFANVLPEKL